MWLRNATQKYNIININALWVRPKIPHRMKMGQCLHATPSPPYMRCKIKILYKSNDFTQSEKVGSGVVMERKIWGHRIA